MSKVLYIEMKRAAVGGQARTVTFDMSSDREDRGGDTVDQSGWRLENYRKNPVVLWNHDQRTPPIGRALNIGVRNGRLSADIEFATAEQHPFADTIFRLVEGGFVNAGSVGFMPLRYEINRETGGLDFKEQELYEYSICGVPMNPDALRRALDSGLDDAAICRAFDAGAVNLDAARSANEYRAELLAKATPGKPTKSALMARRSQHQISRSTLTLIGR